MAQNRHQFMELFLSQFYAEWDGEKYKKSPKAKCFRAFLLKRKFYKIIFLEITLPSFKVIFTIND
jgi:hypothetical protein